MATKAKEKKKERVMKAGDEQWQQRPDSINDSNEGQESAMTIKAQRGAVVISDENQPPYDNYENFLTRITALIPCGKRVIFHLSSKG